MAMEKEGHTFSPPETIMEDENVRPFSECTMSWPPFCISHDVIGITGGSGRSER